MTHDPGHDHGHDHGHAGEHGEPEGILPEDIDARFVPACRALAGVSAEEDQAAG